MITVQPITIKLFAPIKHGKETYTELTFTRRITGSDMLAMDAVQGGLRRTYALYASLCDTPLQVFSQMDAENIEQVIREVAPLLGKSSTATEESPKTE